MSVDAVIIGMGYVGLPLAQAAVSQGLSVVGLDVDEAVTGGMNAGRSHVDDVSDQDIAEMLRRGFQATTEAGRISDADTVVICVPTPLADGGEPDLTYVRAAAEAISTHLRKGTLVILESTTYPGTTREVLRPLLEQSGMRAGKDFHLAYSPERVDPGNPTWGIQNTPKVIGGLTPECTSAAMAFYSRFIDTVVSTKGPEEAETAKLLENTYRHINIALVNEMSRFCHELGIDLWDVIDAAKTKPFGFQAFYPGAGVGGHCIPIDPNYLSYNVRARLGYPFRFVELAQEINQTAPHYVAKRAQKILNDMGKPTKGAKILLLGTSYKPNIADDRESPARPVAKQLIAAGARVHVHDPHLSRLTLGDSAIENETDLQTALQEADLTILLQPHQRYDLSFLVMHSRMLFDTSGRVPTGPGVERL